MILLRRVLLNNNTVDVLIDNGRFITITDDIKPDNSMRVIDCDGLAILPSFANMHTHASMMFLRGVGENKDLMSWLTQDIWPREAKLNHDFVYHLTKYAALEMIRSGTTLFNDMYFYENATVRAIDEMGIRAVIPHLFMDFGDENKMANDIVVANDFLATPPPCPRIIKSVACHAIYTTSLPAFQAAHKLAKQYNTILHLHASETKNEVDECMNKYNVRPIQLLKQWGVLDEKSVLAHCVHIDDDEIKILADSKSMVVHCPVSNMKLNSGVFRLQKCLSNGVNVALGTDGASSNNTLSMIDEMKMAALLAKVAAKSEYAGDVSDIFNMATCNGFLKLGLRAGCIDVGYLADFILVDLNNVFLMPGHNIKSDMVYAADTSCIRYVFCDGVPVMDNGTVPDESQIRDNFMQACKQLM